MHDDSSDFTDEDEENEDFYRDLLKKNDKLPTCPPDIKPVDSISQRCTLCTRKEAEDILLGNDFIEPGHFILRPSAHQNHPYSLSVVENDGTICHFQIGQLGREYLIGPLNLIDTNQAKKFPSIASLLEYHLTVPIKFVEDNQKQCSICLRLYSIETTRF